MSPLQTAWEKCKRDCPFVPYDWEPHKTTFEMGFTAGVDFVFSLIRAAVIEGASNDYKPDAKAASSDSDGTASGDSGTEA